MTSNIADILTSEQLEDLFAAYGVVKHVDIIKGKGFGFVEMSSNDEAIKAKEELNGYKFHTRNIRVSKFKPSQRRRPRKKGSSYKSQNQLGEN
jgi:RNA recognition motif-containing protein